jgi:hypothetical protein
MPEYFHASKPIYLQVADRICYSIVRGEIKVGEKLPFPLVFCILSLLPIVYTLYSLGPVNQFYVIRRMNL